MNKKIVTFTMSLRQSQFEVDRLETEAKKMGIEVNRALYRDLSFDLNNGETKVFVKGEELTPENTMGLWFRVAGTKSGKYTEARNLAIRILRERGIFCVNSKGYLEWTRMGKISQHGVFLENKIPVVPTKIFYTKDQILDFKSDDFFGWEYPVITKHEKGYQGKSVRKFENRKEMAKFVKKINEKNLGMFLWQKCLPTRWDIRVVIVDGKAIGGMKRSAVGEEFRSNFSLGGEVEKWNLSEIERELAEKVARVCGLDYGGVDIMKDEAGNDYILEVNRQCQFQGFEKATGINVAERVVEMIKRRG
ncbi:MAG TPA: ATP-grasp domain-containing protein [Candidatus Methanoperedens sp.]|nr:ATP-grasp domain-containing protein [Candidatus Methanoperedens sp.]